MPTIDELRQVRIEKKEKLYELGVDPYPARTKREHTIEEAKRLMGKRAAVVGRIRSIRGHGGIQFFDLEDQTGKIQLVLKNDLLDEKERKIRTLLDIGDFLAAQGEVIRTQAGEISVLANDFQIIAKALRPLPSNWYGFKDVEERYRKRYLDMLINEEVKKTILTRTQIVKAVREFLDKRGFVEVETPALQPIYGGASARPFITHHNALDMDLYLKISDELYLKRLIVGGLEKVYEIDKDFRNEGIDHSHNPEFTMMECYWAYADYNDMMKLTEELYEYVTMNVLGTTKVIFGKHEIDFKPPWNRLTMKEALIKYAKIDVDALSDDELKELLKKHKLIEENKPTLTGVAAGFSRGVAIATLFEIVEPFLIQPTFIYDFPKETTALCKPKEGDPNLIERFEPYVAGFEIGNAYSELNNPQIQKEFFEEQVKAAKSGDEEAQPMDLAYLEAMEYGMPPIGGLGLGIDRMTMLLTNNENIRDVIIFPTLRPEGKQK